MSYEFVVKEINTHYVCEKCGKPYSSYAIEASPSTIPFVLRTHVYVRDCLCKGKYVPQSIQMKLIPRDCNFYTSTPPKIIDNPNGATPKRDAFYYRIAVRCTGCNITSAHYKTLNKDIKDLSDPELDALIQSLLCTQHWCRSKFPNAQPELISVVAEYPASG
jgi:hypothetical protein